MSEPLRVGLVGCGRLAELGYVPALAVAHGVRLVAVADPDSARAAAVGQGVARYADAAGMLDAGEVDALVLATPAHVHLEDARRAAASGVPVLVEKPPAPDVVGAAELAELPSPVWVALNRRFDPGITRVRASLPPGRALQLDIRLAYLRERWRPVAVGDDVLLDLGPHAIDLASWLVGAEPSSVRARHLSERRASLELRVGTSTARIELANRRPHHERVAVRGARRRLIARHRVGGVHGTVSAAWHALLDRASPGPSAPGHHPLVDSLARQLEAFARAVAGGPGPWPGTAADGVVVMKVIEATRRSAAAAGVWSRVEVR